MKIAISGASGKTGFRIAEEALSKGYSLRLLVRKNSLLPNSLKDCEKVEFSLCNKETIKSSVEECDCLIIATGARPSIDLTGPAKIDAFGVKRQVEACKAKGVKRVILVSSLCSGKWIHPLNLFGLILLWKRVGEKAVEGSGLDWTIIRPGGLNEKEQGLNSEGIFYTQENIQEEGSIPRRLVAKCCVEALETRNSLNKIIEITSNAKQPKLSMNKALQNYNKNK